ncbi:MAG: hypothetical protein GF364_15195 [Candidatus Lokiarchaeota archaeon]|nr:hypothetical protein [Candidatus Lokiarchaeota archaeon]
MKKDNNMQLEIGSICYTRGVTKLKVTGKANGDYPVVKVLDAGSKSPYKHYIGKEMEIPRRKLKTTLKKPKPKVNPVTKIKNILLKISESTTDHIIKIDYTELYNKVKKRYGNLKTIAELKSVVVVNKPRLHIYMTTRDFFFFKNFTHSKRYKKQQVVISSINFLIRGAESTHITLTSRKIMKVIKSEIETDLRITPQFIAFFLKDYLQEKYKDNCKIVKKNRSKRYHLHLQE